MADWLKTKGLHKLFPHLKVCKSDLYLSLSIQLFQLRLSDKILSLKTRPKGNMGSS